MTSEQFADDFLEWYERAVHVSQSLKREALRNAFLNGATIDWRKSGLRDLFTPLIADFSAPQIHLLRTVQLRERARLKDKEEGFSDESLEPPQMVALDELSEAVGGISANHLLALAQDFVRKGLVRDWWQGTFKADEQVLERITLTPLGREFLRFIAEPPRSPKVRS